jgi:hypothetical protein
MSDTSAPEKKSLTKKQVKKARKEKYADNLKSHPSFEELDVILPKYAEDIAAVRELLERKWDDDVIIYQFLKGYKFDIEETAKELNGMLAWREENGMDAIRAELMGGLPHGKYPYAGSIDKCLPKSDAHKTDKLGQPMEIMRVGKMNLAYMLEVSGMCVCVSTV